MKSLTIAVLGLTLLVGIVSQAQPLNKRKQPRDAEPVTDRSVRLTQQVNGWGRTEAEAEANAQQRALDVLQAYLRKQNMALVQQPKLDYVRKHLLVGPAERLAQEDMRVDGAQGPLQLKCMAVQLTLTEASYQDLVKQDREHRHNLAAQERQERGWERLVVVGKIVVLVMLVALLGMAYLRLEHWVRGYPMGWIAAGLAVVLGMVTLGLWWHE